MNEPSEQPAKIGQGSLQAWLRAGGKEAAQVLPAFPDSIRVVEEPGMFGNLTSQEVAAQKQPEREMDYEK